MDAKPHCKDKQVPCAANRAPPLYPIRKWRCQTGAGHTPGTVCPPIRVYSPLFC